MRKFQHNTLALLGAAAMAWPAAASAAPILGGAGAGAGSLPISVGRPIALPGPAGRALPGNGPGALQNGVPGTGAALPAAPAANTEGTISAVSGTTLTLILPNGTKKTYTIGSAAAAKLQAATGRRVDVQTDAKGNIVAVLPADQRVAATVSNVSANAVTLKLADGRTVAFAAGANQAARAGLVPGAQVIVTTHDGGQTSSIALAHTASAARGTVVKLGRSELRELRALGARGTQTVRGVVTRVANDRLTIRLENRVAQTIAIPVGAAERSNIKAGSHVTIATHDGFQSALLTNDSAKK